MTSLEKLIKHFEKFPGIGSRQARRFAFHLLTTPSEDVADLSELIRTIRDTVSECTLCHRFFAKNGHGYMCSICSNPLRDTAKLMVVERDTDIDATERAGTYEGLYFVLGGTIPLLDSPDEKRLRGSALKHSIESRVAQGLREIILAFSVNPDGENTARYIETLLRELITAHALTVNQLGRGLSTGSELEYADPETIKNAFENRRRVV